MAERVSVLSNPYAIGARTFRDVEIILEAKAIRFISPAPLEDLTEERIVFAVRRGDELFVLTNIGDTYLLECEALASSFLSRRIADAVGQSPSGPLIRAGAPLHRTDTGCDG